MGAGVNLFKQLFPEDYYAYQTATLISSKPVSKKIYDSNNQLIAEIALGGDELRGLLKVVDGNLVAVGDVKGSDGNGTEVFDIVDLGTLDWSYFNGVFYYSFGSGVIKKDTINMLTPNYKTIAPQTLAQIEDKCIWSQNNANDGTIIIDDRDYTDAATFKTAMSGKYLICEKATPTAKSYNPFSNPMISGSTEEFTDSRTVKMPCGHDSLYYTSNFKYW